MAGWATKELKSAQLGDARRTKRLIKIVENLTKKPNSTVAEASENWADTKATYDFWDSPYIKPEQVRQPHIDSTIKRIQEHEIILDIQDTTELNYTNHPATKGIGYLDSKYSRGLKVHSTIAVTTLVVAIRSDKSTSMGKRYIRKGNSSRKARNAKLSLRYTSLTIQPPQNRKSQEQLKRIKLQVILALEEEQKL